MGGNGDGSAARWCILRTSPGRTLKLAASLAAAGVAAWAPVRTERRKGRGRGRNDITEISVAIAPGFVFVRKDQMLDLLVTCAVPVSPHPAFSPLRAAGGSIPSIADRSLEPMRAIEERFRRSHLKNVRRNLEIGSTVTIKSGGFAGLSGAVKLGSKGKPVVALGGLFGEIEIASYLVDSDMLEIAPRPAMADAA